MPDLKKAFIRILGDGSQPGDPIEVLYNPAEYTIEKSNTYQNVTIPGLSTPIQQFVSGNADTLTMELFFDTYTRERSKIEDVRNVTGKITKLLEIDGSLHAPPICEFFWGEHPDDKKAGFKAIIERLSQKFTLFLDNGTPVRATLNITFKEYKTIGEQLAEIKRESADRTQRVVFKEGDSLWLFAAQEYGDPTLWRVIAKENEIDNPRTVLSGTELTIPPLE